MAGLLTACGGGPTDPGPASEAPGLQAISCVADLTLAEIQCGAAPGLKATASGSLTIGGQGTYVHLASSGTGYNAGTQIFTTTVTVENLLAGPLGTSDGLVPDPSGIEVFFHAGPMVTSGVGTVGVANPDGVGNFTGPAQPFYRYPGNLPGGATSSGKVWEFSVPGSVTTFSFQVYVRAQVPQPAGILRFLADSLGTSGTIYSVTGTSLTNVFATGVFDVEELLGGRILRWDGAGWTTLNDFPDLLYGSYAIGPTLFAVGPDGVIWFTGNNGADWTRTRISSGVLLTSAWASAPGDLYAAGGDGAILRSSNGTSWAPMASGSIQFLNWIWGTGSSDIFAVGFNGTILHFNGSLWSPVPPPVGFATTTFYGVGGTTGGTLFVVGSGGTILRSVNGGASWTADASGTASTLRSVWCPAATDCIAAGDQGTVRRWNGEGWSSMSSGTVRMLRTAWGASPTTVFLAGDQGTSLRGVR